MQIVEPLFSGFFRTRPAPKRRSGRRKVSSGYEFYSYLPAAYSRASSDPLPGCSPHRRHHPADVLVALARLQQAQAHRGRAPLEDLDVHIAHAQVFISERDGMKRSMVWGPTSAEP